MPTPKSLHNASPVNSTHRNQTTKLLWWSSHACQQRVAWSLNKKTHRFFAKPDATTVVKENSKNVDAFVILPVLWMSLVLVNPTQLIPANVKENY